MAPRRVNLAEDAVPNALAGVVTTFCECGWEIVSISPEEDERRLSLILLHLMQKHGLVMPSIQYYAH